MEAIYSSKLFKTSPRKDALKAAIENPINTELVQQLRRYLDKEYLKPEYVLRESDQKKEKTPDEKGQTDVLFEGGPEFAPRSAPSMPSSLPDDSLEEEPLPDEEQTLDEETESEEPVAEESTSEEPVSESVKIQAMIGTTYLDDEPQISPDVIKGTLNNRTDCMGVSRVSIKNNELWIYYNDNINLNNVMEQVIQLLELSGYASLSFNRLARTDNAIVFEISKSNEAKEIIE